MKILFTGLPYFGKKLVDELNQFDPQNKYVFCDTYYSRKDRIKFLGHLPGAKKVVSFNGVTSESGSLNWVLRFGKELIMQWHGSDVLTAKENLRNNTFTRKYLNASRSYSDAPWLISELKDLNVHVEHAAFKFVNVQEKSSPFESADVFSYMGSGSEKFYGIDQLIEMAKNLPETQFYICGTDGKDQEKLANITYLGWISEEVFEKYLNRCAIFLRLAEHDGYSLSALKALANGNYLIWSCPHPHAEYLSPDATGSAMIRQLQEKINAGNQMRNKEAVEWARVNLDRKKILTNYVQVLTQPLKTKKP